MRILSNNYYVNFNKEAYSKLNEYIANSTPSKIIVLVDENTAAHCLPVFDKALNTSGYELITIKSGEKFKNLKTCELVWDRLTSLGADRKSLLINLGGGVITDLGGFVASTFKRGIKFINIPTTLLSMVDASVGGKTGVDFGVLKNQIGLFADPEMVIIDSEYLNTLDQRELRSGLAEIIKYGLSYDVKLWDEIKGFNELLISNIEKLIFRSIEIKNEVVTEDPKENGLRKILNFGHTLGHAIESYFLENSPEKKLLHGEAIAIGMIAAGFISNQLLNFPLNALETIKAKLCNIYGKVVIDPSTYNEIIALLMHDKKNVGGQVNFVLLSDFEKFQLDCKVNENIIRAALDYYQA